MCSGLFKCLFFSVAHPLPPESLLWRLHTGDNAIGALGGCTVYVTHYYITCLPNRWEEPSTKRGTYARLGERREDMENFNQMIPWNSVGTQ